MLVHHLQVRAALRRAHQHATPVTITTTAQVYRPPTGKYTVVN
jgi:hypothetical protein